MGYWTRMYLYGIKVRKDRRAELKRILKNHKTLFNEDMRFFLDSVDIDQDGFLEFKASDDGTDCYMECEGFVPAKDAKWYNFDEIAEWLKQFSEFDGQMILHSLEGDGLADGFVFDGNGKRRRVTLKQVGKWK